MTISELIKELQKLKPIFGEVRVQQYGNDEEYHITKGVEFRVDYYTKEKFLVLY